MSTRLALAAVTLLVVFLAASAPALAIDPDLKVTPAHPGPRTPIKVTFTTPTALRAGWYWWISIDSCGDESAVRIVRHPRRAGVRVAITIKPALLPFHHRWCRGLSPVSVAKGQSDVLYPVADTTVRIR